MEKVRNWTKIWNVERVFYKLWEGVALPRPVTQTFGIWFAIAFGLGLFRIPPFMMEHTITRQVFCPWLFAFLMTRKQFQGRKPYNYLASFLLFCFRPKHSFHGQFAKAPEKKAINEKMMCVVRYGGAKNEITKSGAEGTV